MKTHILAVISLIFVTGPRSFADEPVIVFRSVDDVRREIDRWDLEDRDPYDSDEIIDVQMTSDQPTLGVLLDENPLGPQVEKVIAGSAADRAGMEVGDHLKTIENAKVDSIEVAGALVDRHPVGKVMEITFQRNNYMYQRRVRFLPKTESTDVVEPTSLQLREQVNELERKLLKVRARNEKLREAVRFLLKDQLNDSVHESRAR